MQVTIDENEAYERRDSLIFSGSSIPACSTAKICINIVENIVANKLGVNISASDFSVYQRLRKKKMSQGGENRPIIAKFCRRDA